MANTEKQVMDLLHVGDKLMYPVYYRDNGDKGWPVTRKAYVPCRIRRIYPHLVEVTSASWRALPMRTITYKDMIADPQILSGLNGAGRRHAGQGDTGKAAG